MLLKTRREFTLCFFLFVPLGMAGYCAGVQPADTPVQPTKSNASDSKSRAVAKKGGQPAPQSPSGGLSSAEQLSRLLVDGRRAYRDGELLTAQSYFRDALKLDSQNDEAQRFLRDIEQKSSGARFSPDGLSAQIPAGSPRSEKVDVKGIVEAVKANATPEPITQSLGGKEQVSLNKGVSVSLGANSNSFSKPVSVSLDSSPAVSKLVEPKEVVSAAAQDAKPSAILNIDGASKDEPADDAAKAEQVAAKKAADDKAAAEKVEKLAAEKAEREKSEREAKEAADRKEADRVAAEIAAEQAAQRKAIEKAEAEKAKVEAEKAKAEAVAKAEAEAKEKADKEKADAEAKAKAEKELAEKKAAEKAEREKAEKEIAARKAEEEKKLKEERELAEAKKAEEAKKVADAEKAAREAKDAEEKAEKDRRIAQAKAEKEQFSKAVTETNAGIKLYNAGKYDEARQKFEAALVTQPDYREAKNYLERADRKITAAEEKAKEKESAAPALNLDELKTNMKEVAQASSSAAVQSAVVADEATSAPAATEGKGDAAAEEKSADPIVEADKLLREAQTNLADGKREQALDLARKAAELDPKNVNASALVKELASEGSKALPSLNEVTAAAAAVSVETDKAVETTSLDVATSDVVSPPLIDSAPSGVSSLLSEGRSKFESGQIREANTAFKAVLEIDADNAEAKTYIRKIEVARAGEVALPSLGGPGGSAQTAQDAESAFQQGLVAYQAGRLDVAVQHWNFSLTLDPNHPRSVQYLEQTRSEYEAWVQQHQYNAIELQKEVSATNKLETAVTYDSSGQKTLVEYLQAMSLITDISFYVADGVDPDLRVTAKFDQTILQDALDIVLLPIGLKWHRTGDVVTITTDLHNKFYNLTPDQVARLKPLLENRTLHRVLYGPEGVPPMRNVECLLDDRENMLMVTDSVENLNKIEAFLKELQVDAPQQLVFKNWKVRPEEAQRIKALVEAIVKVNSDAAWDLDRRVVVDGDDLIVKDTADNVARIEQLLLDKNFLAKLEDRTLNVQNYSLIPREPIGPENVEQARDMAQSVVTVVKTILYSQNGEESAAAEGRRFWYDPNTLQLTITDFPNNLEIVSDYLKSLPTLSSSQQKSEIVRLNHQTAADMQSLLEQVLGLSSTGIGGSSSGQAVTKTVRRDGELVFGDLRIRVRRIEENEENDDSDDSAELIVRTATSSQDLTLEEYQTEFVDEYEITAEDVRPSESGEGEGSVRLRVAISLGGVAGAGFGPGLGVGVPGVGGGLPGVGLPGVPALTSGEESGIVIESVANMNALLIRYTNPSDLDEVKRWLKELDIPVTQVSIETKLVEVNETRAKEFMPELNWANIGHGSPDFSQGTNFFDFAKNENVGELGRSPYDPFAEDTYNMGLLKGTSVFNIITGGESPISFTLRALESEGVVNMTNGPMITVENGQLAEFTISRDFGLVSTQIGQSGSSNNRSVPRINHVDMSVTPQITKTGEIRLEITDLNLNDFGNQIGNLFPIVISDNNNQQNDDIPVGPIVGNVPYEVRRRTITTVARVKNHGTIVLGGWTGERSRTNDSGVPILRNMPYVGKLLFGRTSDKIDRTNLLIFLTCHLVDP